MDIEEIRKQVRGLIWYHTHLLNIAKRLDEVTAVTLEELTVKYLTEYMNNL